CPARRGCEWRCRAWWPPTVAARTSGVRNDRQQEMRWMPRVVIDLVQHGLAAADVIRDVLHIGGAADAGRDVEAGDLDADAVTLLELIGGRHDLDGVFVDLAGNDGLAGRARERVPRPARQRSLRIDGTMGRLEPAARELAFVQAGRDVALAFARGLHADIR